VLETDKFQLINKSTSHNNVKHKNSKNDANFTRWQQQSFTTIISLQHRARGNFKVNITLIYRRMMKEFLLSSLCSLSINSAK